jgi:hypothetical protein
LGGQSVESVARGYARVDRAPTDAAPSVDFVRLAVAEAVLQRGLPVSQGYGLAGQVATEVALRSVGPSPVEAYRAALDLCLAGGLEPPEAADLVRRVSVHPLRGEDPLFARIGRARAYLKLTIADEPRYRMRVL